MPWLRSRLCFRLARNLLFVCVLVIIGNYLLFLHQSYLARETNNLDSNNEDDAPPSTNKYLDSNWWESENNQKYENRISQEHLDADWKVVNGSNKRLFLYSAWDDTRFSSRMVRIIAITSRRVMEDIYCLLFYQDGSSLTVKATVKKIQEHWNLQYISAFIVCKYSDDLEPPVEVAMKTPNSIISDPILPVRSFDHGPNEEFMAVCVKPFHYNFNRAVWLVEFIEFHRLLGVDHFFFYNHTLGPDVQKALTVYTEEGVATVLPWTLPVISQEEIRTEGIFSALNDCNLRSVGRFTYTIMIDVDEFIIPREHNTYKELLSVLGDHGEYNFKNDFFYLYWDNDTAVHDLLYFNDSSLGSKLFGSEEDGPYLLTAYKTNRMANPHKHGTRSKYINKPSQSVEIGNHNIWQFTSNSQGPIEVHQILGICHHYRICEFGGFDCLQHDHFVDRRAHKWLFPLVNRVAHQCQKMFSATGLCPEAPPLGSPW